MAAWDGGRDSRGEHGGGDDFGRGHDGGMFGERSRCRFCRDKAWMIDFKDIQTLQKLCTAQGKMFSRKRSGNCARHQRMVKWAVKRARYMALLPFVG